MNEKRDDHDSKRSEKKVEIIMTMTTAGRAGRSKINSSSSVDNQPSSQPSSAVKKTEVL